MYVWGGGEGRGGDESRGCVASISGGLFVHYRQAGYDGLRPPCHQKFDNIENTETNCYLRGPWLRCARTILFDIKREARRTGVP